MTHTTTAEGSPNSFLATDRNYGDFILVGIAFPRCVFLYAVLGSFCGFSFGCEAIDRDTTLRKRIVGTWEFENVKAVYRPTFHSDGTLSIELSGKGMNKFSTIITSYAGGDLQGTWAISDGTLTMNIRGLSGPAARAFLQLVGTIGEAAGGENISEYKPWSFTVNSIQGNMITFDNGPTWRRLR